MSAEVFACEASDMGEVIDQYLTEDDKRLIYTNVRGTKVRSINKDNQFLLYSIAKKVKKFIEDGHFVSFLSYGVDYILNEKPSAFTFEHFVYADELAEAVYGYCFECYQEHGGIEEELLDKTYAWLLMTPYAAMSMTENTRHVLHRAVEFLWLCPATADKSLSIQCYEHGRQATNESIQHWMDNVQIMYKGCGYANIIEPQEC